MSKINIARRRSGIVLREYQLKSAAAVLKELRVGHPTLLVAPTGAGKTIIAAQIAKKYKAHLLVAHRLELVEQARAFGLRAMSIMSALRRGPKQVDLLFIDEAHRSAATTYRDLIAKYPRAARVGLTATPLRTDGKGLCDAFSRLVVSSSVSELVDSGYLVPYRAFEAPDEALDRLTSLRKRAGDYATKELSRLMDVPRLVGDVVREFRAHALGRKTIVFAVSIKHSQHLAEAFNGAGIRAAHLDGRASEKVRKTALKELSDGKIDVLCNVNLFTEGWDCPSVSCVIMARPTASLTLYLQSVGRGMRTSDGKQDLVILDHAGNIDRHGKPDDIREWSLESEASKSKREAEVRELERLYSLGFASIEAELEEKRRIREEGYSAEELRSLDPLFRSVARGKLSDFLRTKGILKIRGNNSNAIYSKKTIREFLEEWHSQYSSEECATALSAIGSKAQVSSFLRRRGIENQGKSAGAARYSRSDVDTLIEEIRNSYTAKEVADLFSVRRKNISTFLRRRGIQAVLGGVGNRYPKLSIDALLSS